MVRTTRETLAAMNPVLDPEDFVFCSATDPAIIDRARPEALCLFREPEGTSLVLPRAVAEKIGFDISRPMRRITLMASSELDGVGLTAAVSVALAEEKIPCNVVAAYRHDHLFVPADMAERALAILMQVQSEAADSRPEPE